MRRARWGVVLAWFAVGGGWAVADEPPAQFSETQTVEAAAPPAEDLAAFATTLDARELVDGGEDLAELLRRVPGTRIFSFGGVGRYATISQRGSTSEQVTVMVDGVPQNRALGGSVDLSFFPIGSLDTVTVFRGFAPASSGAFGLGGLVDIRTTAPQRAAAVDVALQIGSLSTRRATWGARGRLGGTGAWFVSAERFASAGDYRYLDTAGTPGLPADDRLRRRRNNGVELAAITAQSRWETPRWGVLALNLNWKRRVSGIPGVDSLPTEQVNFAQRAAGLLASWSLAAERPEASWQRVDCLVDLQTGFDRLRDDEAELGVRRQSDTTRRGGGVAALALWGRGALRWTARLDLRRESARVHDRAIELASDRGGARRQLTALTVETSWRSAHVTLAPSWRIERVADDFLSGSAGTVPPPASDVTRQHGSGKLALAVALSPRVVWRSSIGRFHRVPALDELFGNRGAVMGNPRLVPERGISAETGVSWARSFEAVLFATEADELIVFVPNSQAAAVARNLGASSIRGLELAGQGSFSRRLSFEVTGTWQRARSDAAFNRGKPLPGRPKVEGFASLRWRAAPWQIAWNGTYVGATASDLLDRPEFRLPARVLHDVQIGRDFGTHWRLTVDLQNVADRRTLDVARFPLPGRVVSLTLRRRGEV